MSNMTRRQQFNLKMWSRACRLMDRWNIKGQSSRLLVVRARNGATGVYVRPNGRTRYLSFNLG